MRRQMRSIYRVFLILFVILTSIFVSGAELNATVEDGVFRVGMECAYAPNNWTSTTATPTAVPIAGGQYCDGFDVVIAQKLATGLGRALVIEKTAWDGLIPSLQSNQIDAIIAGMSPTQQRKQQIAFSDIYYRGKFGIVVNKSGQYANGRTISDFAGAKVTAQLATFHVDLIKQLTGAIEVPPMKDFSTMTVAAKAQEIDGFIADIATGTTITAQNSDLEYIILDGEGGLQVSEDTSGVAVGLRKEDTALLEQINAILSTISPEDIQMYMNEAIAREPGSSGAAVSENSSFFGQIATLWGQYSQMFITGTLTTILISVVATILGFIMGLLMAILRSNKIGKFLVMIYVTIIRGTPMMVQAMIIFYGVAFAIKGFQWSNIPNGRIIAGIIIVTINTGAYMAETIRSGIQAIDDGQFEAAKSLGFTRWQTMTNIILPQAVRNVLPALGNEFIVNIKDTSVLNVIGVVELFFMSSSVSGATYQFFQTFTITALIYLFLTTIFSLLLGYTERKLHIGKKSTTNFLTSQTN